MHVRCRYRVGERNTYASVSGKEMTTEERSWKEVQDHAIYLYVCIVGSGINHLKLHQESSKRSNVVLPQGKVP